MKPFDPTRPLYWSAGGDILERDHTEIGDRLLASGRPLADPAARLAVIDSDIFEATALRHDLKLPELTRARDDLTTAMTGAASWTRATKSLNRRAA